MKAAFLIVGVEKYIIFTLQKISVYNNNKKVEVMK
jgi:hypothetical protein